MRFVGIGAVHPLMLVPVIAGAAFYAFYLWSLSRLLAKAGFLPRCVVYAVGLDVFLSLLGYGWGHWLWNWVLHPPIPVSAFGAIFLLAFTSWPLATNRKVESDPSLPAAK